jgi:hypothetical protein
VTSRANGILARTAAAGAAEFKSGLTQGIPSARPRKISNLPSQAGDGFRKKIHTVGQL